jgi:hypothetical protein
MPTRRGFIAASALAASSLVPVRSNTALAASTNPQTFTNAYTAFNNRDWAALASYLAGDVVLVKIKSNHSVVGKSEVLHYMKTYVASDSEKFDPTGALSGNNYTPNWNNTNTTVFGKADWQDADISPGSLTILPIFYRFRFNDANTGKIDRMFGSPD